MFTRLLNRKTEPAPAARPTGPAPRPDPMDMEFLHTLHMEALRALLGRGAFTGCLAQLPGFERRRMPEGVEVAHHADARLGAVVSEHALALQGAGYDATQWCLVHLHPILERMQPSFAFTDWQPRDGGMSAVVPIGSALELAVDCGARDDVDFAFTGDRKEVGAMLVLDVRRRGA